MDEFGADASSDLAQGCMAGLAELHNPHEPRLENEGDCDGACSIPGCLGSCKFAKGHHGACKCSKH
jgi:hypothetical protein